MLEIGVAPEPERRLKIAIVHNAYQKAGGEDAVVQAEKSLLLRAGHEVSQYLRHNNEIESQSFYSNLALGVRTVWSSSSRNGLHGQLQKWKPDVVHFHNTFPLISPAAYYACRDLGLPVVQTLHNYRIFCPSGAFFRDGRVCEECFDKSRWLAVRHACVRQSRSATSATVAMLSFHHHYGTWTNLVDRYIALSEFSRAKFLSGGLPEEKIVVKPNFVVDDPGVGSHDQAYAVFIGRLSEEKGLRTLIRAWRRVGPRLHLRIIGDGPLHAELRSERYGLPTVHLAGHLSREESMKILQGARFLVLPSVCYENFPMTLAEAYACATPVIASRLGAMEELVKDGRTGLHFAPGDDNDLATKVQWACAHHDEMVQMGANARVEFEAKYTADRNYRMLIAIYESVTKSVPDQMLVRPLHVESQEHER